MARILQVHELPGRDARWFLFVDRLTFFLAHQWQRWQWQCWTRLVRLATSHWKVRQKFCIAALSYTTLAIALLCRTDTDTQTDRQICRQTHTHTDRSSALLHSRKQPLPCNKPDFNLVLTFLIAYYSWSGSPTHSMTVKSVGESD